MTTQGVKFLNDWIERNVNVGAPPDDPLSASNLAMRCIAEAVQAGFTLEEIKPDTGTIESYIADAIADRPHQGTPSD